MTEMVPAPNPSDIPFNEAVGVTLDPGQEATTTFTAEQRTNDGFLIPILAASKYASTSYEVKLDGDTVYGPAPIPPTDIDNIVVTWAPAYEFDQELKVIISNLGSNTETYHIQPIGFERRGE